MFHQAMARALADNGVTTVFGLIGDANLYMVDSFVNEADGALCSVANEAAAVLAAHGYAKATAGLGVATDLAVGLKGAAKAIGYGRCGDRHSAFVARYRNQEARTVFTGNTHYVASSRPERWAPL